MLPPVACRTAGAFKKAGLQPTLIRAGKRKIEANPWEPLSKTAREQMQADINSYYTMFVRAVARNRGTTPEAVRAGYGQGRLLLAKEAVAAGLVDGVATFDAAVAKSAGLAEGRARMKSLRHDIAASVGGEKALKKIEFEEEIQKNIRRIRANEEVDRVLSKRRIGR